MSPFNWRCRFMLSALCEWCLMLLEGFRAQRSQSGLFCLRSRPCPRSWVLGLCMLHKIVLLTKAAECEFVCMADPHQSEAVKDGRGFNSTHISSFSASQDIVVVYLRLFMEKQEASSYALTFLCCADSSVWSGHVSNQHSALRLTRG